MLTAHDPNSPWAPYMSDVTYYVGVALTATGSDGKHPMHLPDVGPYWTAAARPQTSSASFRERNEPWLHAPLRPRRRPWPPRPASRCRLDAPMSADPPAFPG